MAVAQVRSELGNITPIEKRMVVISFLLIYLGLSLNGIVLWANDWKMAVFINEDILGEDMAKHIKDGIERAEIHTPLTDNHRLHFLADRFYFIDDGASMDIRIFSIGDICIYIGGFLTLVTIVVILLHINYKEWLRSNP